MIVLVATSRSVVAIDPQSGAALPVDLPPRMPTCIALAPSGEAWCGTREDGVFTSNDAGRTWHPAGLRGERISAIAPSPVEPDLVFAGTEPGTIRRSEDAGRSWDRCRAMEELASSSEWSFPPRPDTHHVRWIACHPDRAGRLWVAIEAGALVGTFDRGETWQDRVRGGPYDTHELAIHPLRPDSLRVAAGDGWFESDDGGRTWSTPDDGLDVGYMRSVAIDPGDPDVVVVSAASGPGSAYGAGSSDGRLYRRAGDEPWARVRQGWPAPPSTMAPLLAAGGSAGELWAADERGVHRSADCGVRWEQIAAFEETPRYLVGFAVGPSAG